jgi:hypothetical protein
MELLRSQDYRVRVAGNLVDEGENELRLSQCLVGTDDDLIQRASSSAIEASALEILDEGHCSTPAVK